MRIELTYGKRQRFRPHHSDLNLSGRIVGAELPVRDASYRLNDAKPVGFYVEHVADPGIDWTTQYKASPAVNRLKDAGDFNIEIPVGSSALYPGANIVMLEVVDARGMRAAESIELTWDPNPVPLPLDLRDLRRFKHIQEIGQVVDGAFDLDPVGNCIRSRAPVYPDSLLLLGGPYGSQEATYQVVFRSFAGVKWLGPSDFFAGHEDGSPPIGVKPGWSTIGMAALTPRGEARAFLAWGDHSGQPGEWVVQTDPPVAFPLAENIPYRVRHQVLVDDGRLAVRYRIWPSGTPEPDEWLCVETNTDVPTELPRPTKGSFGLFQHSGGAIEWSDVLVAPLSGC